MQVISKKRMTFHRSEIVGGPTAEKHEHVFESFTVNNDPALPQTAPDWIVNDGLFALAVQDGDLTIFETPQVELAEATQGELPTNNDDVIAASSETNVEQ